MKNAVRVKKLSFFIPKFRFLSFDKHQYGGITLVRSENVTVFQITHHALQTGFNQGFFLKNIIELMAVAQCDLIFSGDNDHPRDKNSRVDLSFKPFNRQYTVLNPNNGMAVEFTVVDYGMGKITHHFAGVNRITELRE